jgi:uroporphyrinogen decarboxylase
MCSRERVLTALAHQQPDRIPTFDSFWAEFRDLCVDELGLPANVDLAEHFDIDVRIAVADETPFPTRTAVLSDDGLTRRTRDGWGRVSESVRGAFFSRELDVAVRRPADLDALVFDSPQLGDRYGNFQRDVQSWRDRYCVFCKTGGPYLRTTSLRGEVNFLTDIAADPVFARALADRVADHLIQIGLESLRRGGLHETGLWIYDDMGNNRQPMMSPASFERIFLPAYARMITAFKDAGAAHVILHSDGNVEPLLDMLVEAGITGLNPLEPRAGFHLPTIKQRFGDRLALIGGMCNSHVLPEGPEERIHAQAREIVEAGRDGGVVIGAHSIGPDIGVTNYQTYRKLVRMEGQYR